MSSEKILIFDFDGTIADSGKYIIQILNNLHPIYGLRKIEENEIEQLKNLSSRELLKKFKVPAYKIPFIFFKFRREFAKIVPELKPIPGISEVIMKLNEENQKMYILSSNTQDNIRLFLKNNNIEYFDKVFGKVSLFGKYIKIKRIIKNENLDPKNVIYIGDETRDIESARKANIKIASVAWGISSKQILEKNKPDFLLSKPEELLKLK